MDNRRFHIWADFVRLRCNVRVTCQRCKHSAIFDRNEIADWFRIRGWESAVSGKRWRCTICRAKGKVVFDPSPHDPSDRLKKLGRIEQKG